LKAGTEPGAIPGNREDGTRDPDSSAATGAGLLEGVAGDSMCDPSFFPPAESGTPAPGSAEEKGVSVHMTDADEVRRRTQAVILENSLS